MKLEFNGHQYQVSLTDNATVKDIVANLPLKLTLKRYDDHEFPGELPFTPQKSEGTSTIKISLLNWFMGKASIF
ncbi:cyclophilin-like fold protein [Limosilactobacillus fermentum]|uniref:cyclophilin-like fold protein n=1 Tax=Limosilactobacillus fermentum TaxID=1613 RepID=UPI000C250668|nr:cyclophilin-like fold protein [Limosilactobacillus fermentum]MBM9561381.1 hypothetical protein [Limosilactobacillus fermentum]